MHRQSKFLILQSCRKLQSKSDVSSEPDKSSYKSIETLTSTKGASKSFSEASSQNNISEYSGKPESTHSSDTKSMLPTSVIKPYLTVKVPEKPTSDELPSPVKRYFLGRYSKYLERFQQSLANEMPDTFHMFNTFAIGFKDFVLDFRDYIKLLVKQSLPFNNMKDLSRKEHELYFNMPRQMLKVAPVLIISSFPFAQNIVLPVSYWFPRQLLCYHFWDMKQKQEFGIFFLTKRLYNARPVFRSLQARLNEIQDPILKESCQSAFYSLGSGIHPSVQEILDLTELFNQEPFHINSLWSAHINGLLRLHNRSVWFRRRNRLYDHAKYIQCLDNAISREGINTLTSEQQRNMLLLRGVNPTGMTNLEQIEYLEKWIQISTRISGNAYSLLLHLPIFLAYNHPTNLILIYK